MKITSQTTLNDLEQQLYLVKHQILSFQDKLQDSVTKYSTTPQNDTHRNTLFAESYYLNELIGYLRQQSSLISRYMVHLSDEGPSLQWDRKAFWDYPGDEQFKLKCLQTIENPYFHHLWLKQIHFLAKSFFNHKHTVHYHLHSTNPQNFTEALQKQS